MNFFNGKPIRTDTGHKLFDGMYTLAVMDTHHGKSYWRVLRQTTSNTHALMAYMDMRDIFGDEATLALVRPGEIRKLTVVK